jgi:outer membrane receptor protein involved in Fe transport
MYGTTDGIEVAANWKITNRWTVSPGYALLQMHLHTNSSSQDTTVAPHTEGSSPRHQAQLRSHVELDRGLAWDMNVFFVDSLPAQQIPSYTRMDTQVTWRIAERLQFSAVGQNLLSDHHAESNDTFTSVNSSQVKRGGYAQFTWRF